MYFVHDLQVKFFGKFFYKIEFKCKSCRRLFTQADFLRRHIKIIDEFYKDFKYDSCVKLFTHVGNVRRHIKTAHEGHKDFKCKSCEKSYT